MTKHHNAVAKLLGAPPFEERNSFTRSGRKRILLLILITFVTAVSFRTAAWNYWSAEAVTVQSTVATNYKIFARLLLTEGLTGLFRPNSRMSNPDLLGHPPGYPMLLAGIYKLFGESNAVVQFVQILADALAAVVILLIVAELLNTTVGFLAGILSAASPQFAWNSILLLPDTLAVLPLLLAIYLLTRTFQSSRLLLLFLAGVLIGISCLLRPNALLFAPFLFVVVPVTSSLTKVKRPVLATAILVVGTVTVIAPFTIRNAIVFGRFVPLSIGAGQTLLEGIADYDSKQRFGFSDTDVGIAAMEAERFNRPDYAETLFGPDGIERDRYRLRRGLQVIFSHPVWFGVVMIQRAASMVRMERVPLISAEASKASGYPAVLRLTQSIFTTAVILPLALLGAALVVAARLWATLVLLSLIPLYYFFIQSALHTEYRYILALNHLLLAFTAIAVYVLARGVLRLKQE